MSNAIESSVIATLAVAAFVIASTAAFTPSTGSGKSDIVDTAIADGRFKTLVTALGAAELVDTLRGEGPFTVFAPTDAAFEALPEGTVENLLGNIPALKEILLYHVVAGNVTSSEVVELESAATVLGKDLWIKVEDGSVMINDSKVIIADIETSNGVIHVIDAVLIPPQE